MRLDTAEEKWIWNQGKRNCQNTRSEGEKAENKKERNSLCDLWDNTKQSKTLIIGVFEIEDNLWAQ